MKQREIKLVVECSDMEDLSRRYTQACLKQLDKMLKDGAGLEELLARTQETMEKIG